MSEPQKLPPILLVDDDPNDLFFVRRRLDKAGAKNPIVTFTDGEQVLEFLRKACDGEPTPEETPCVVFLDIKLPRIDGFEVLRWIRSQPRFESLPVIMLSGSAEQRDIERATKLRATRYLTKLPPVQTFQEVLAAFAGK